MNRITQRDLDHAVKVLNVQLGRPAEPWVRENDGTYAAQIGNIHLSGAYGGWQVHEMVGPGGGIRALTSGYESKRTVYGQLNAMIAALRSAEDATR